MCVCIIRVCAIQSSSCDKQSIQMVSRLEKEELFCNCYDRAYVTDKTKSNFFRKECENKFFCVSLMLFLEL